MSRPRDYSPTTADAARLLGSSIRIARKERRWTIEDLAERVGASHSTIRKVERGDLGVTLGIALEAASILRVPLFHEDPAVRRGELERAQQTLRLLPRRTTRLPEPDDDF